MAGSIREECITKVAGELFEPEYTPYPHMFEDEWTNDYLANGNIRSLPGGIL